MHAPRIPRRTAIMAAVAVVAIASVAAGCGGSSSSGSGTTASGLRRAAPRLRVLSHSEIPETHSIRIGSVIGAAGPRWAPRSSG